jgi:hypothetical protein
MPTKKKSKKAIRAVVPWIVEQKDFDRVVARGKKENLIKEEYGLNSDGELREFRKSTSNDPLFPLAQARAQARAQAATSPALDVKDAAKEIANINDQLQPGIPEPNWWKRLGKKNVDDWWIVKKLKDKFGDFIANVIFYALIGLLIIVICIVLYWIGRSEWANTFWEWAKAKI